MGTDIHGVFQARKDGDWKTVPSSYNFERQYSLFACLAGVRNGFGFAGVSTFSPITPISSPRGLPEGFPGEIGIEDDCASPWEREYREKFVEDSEKTKPITRWMGDHSHSWLAAAEILAYSWPKLKRTGVISLGQFNAWDGVSSPESWSGDISGLGIVVAENYGDISPETTHVRVNWVSDAKVFDEFINEVKRLKEEHEDVRFVFGFDS